MYLHMFYILFFVRLSQTVSTNYHSGSPTRVIYFNQSHTWDFMPGRQSALALSVTV